MKIELPVLFAIVLLGIGPVAAATSQANTNTDEVKATPTAAIQYFYQARNCRDSHEYDAGIKAIGKAIALQPKRALFYYFRGELRQRTGDEAGARADYNKALGFKPDTITKATIEEKLGDYTGAISDYRKSLREPECAYVKGFILTTLAHLQIQTGDNEGAIETYSQLLEVSPNPNRHYEGARLFGVSPDPILRYERAHLLLTLGQLPEALDDLNSALKDKHKFDCLPAFRDRAYVRLRLGDLPGAADDYWQSDGAPFTHKLTRWLYKTFNH